MKTVWIFSDRIWDRNRLERFRSVRIRVRIFNIRYRIRIRILKSYIYDVDIQSYLIRHDWHYPYSNPNPTRNLKTNMILVTSVSDPFTSLTTASTRKNNLLGGNGQLVTPKEMVFPWRFVTAKKTTFLGGCKPSRKLLSLAVATFSWRFGKLSMVVVSLGANLQENHPWVSEPPRKLISLSFYPWVCLLDGLWSRIVSLAV